jgi:hypothetical protein
MTERLAHPCAEGATQRECAKLWAALVSENEMDIQTGI